MASTLFDLGYSIQLSPQVSESLAFDLSFLPFIQSCLQRHQSGDFGDVYGPALESNQECAAGGGRVCSRYFFDDTDSCLEGMGILIVSPRARDTTFVSFIGEL